MQAGKLIICLIFFGCNTHDNKIGHTVPILRDVKIVNIDGADRETIAELITDITKCGPIVIAINTILEGTQELKSDTKLSNAIQIAGNVVMVNVIENNQLLKSDQFFSEKAVAQGVVTYGYSELDGLTYEVFHSYQDLLLWSFPAIIVSQYDPKLGLGLINNFSPNTYYEFQMKWSRENIVILDPVNIDCSELNNSIVLLGDIGPIVRPEYVINSTGNKEYSTIILANILAELLGQ